MDHERYDSSGTDDDFPLTHQNRVPRGARLPVGSIPYPRMYGKIDVESQIHQLEKEAYRSVLRAFKAQADAITWEKETLITELRKELKLSNEEQGELLGHVIEDVVVQNIREWRQAGGNQPGVLSVGQAIHDSIPSPTISASRKKQKATPSAPSQSFGGPSLFHPQLVAATVQMQKATPSAPSQSFGGPSPFHPQPVAVPVQMQKATPSSPSQSFGGPSPFHSQSVAAPVQSSSVAKRGSKGKKHKPGQVLPGVSSIKQCPSSGLGGRNQVYNRVTSGTVKGELAEGALKDSLVGRRVRIRWPDDDNFYEAIITDYNRSSGEHALFYDSGTANESWEWVNLSEMPPEDIEWVGEDPGVNLRRGFGGSGNGMGMSRSVGCGSVPGVGRGRGNGDVIQILHTDKLVKEVQRVFNADPPDALEMERTEKVLKDHEKSLIDAIARLGDVSDGED